MRFYMLLTTALYSEKIGTWEPVVTHQRCLVLKCCLLKGNCKNKLDLCIIHLNIV